MGFVVMPLWRDQDGGTTGPTYPASPDVTRAEALVLSGLKAAERARGTDVRVLVVDDFTWRTLYVVRPKMAAAGDEALRG